MNNVQPTNPKKSSRKKWLFLGLGLLTTGVLSFFGYQYWKSNKNKTEAPASDAPDFTAEKSKPEAKPKAKKPTTKKPASKKSTTPKQSPESTSSTFPDYFPLRKGSEGPRVKQLQQALINKYGKSFLPTGATGIFDAALEAALKRNGLPTAIDETAFNVLAKKIEIDPGLIARGLQVALRAKNFSAALRILKVIKSPAQYAEVNKVFLKYLIEGVRKTIVNAALSTFKSEKQKQDLRLAFRDIGLKYDGKKWTLSGLDGRPLLITTQTTKVWKDPRTSVEVPKNMVLGKEIERRSNYIMFENDRQFFLVKEAHVSHFKN